MHLCWLGIETQEAHGVHQRKYKQNSKGWHLIKRQKFSISLFIQSNWFFLKVIKGFSSHWRIFHLYGDFAITVEGLDLYSWPLSSKGCLTYYIYCDTGQPFIVVISKDPWNTPFAERLAVEQSLPVLTT